ncbi:MAG: hypothetical protein IJU72_01735 [Bacteroidales bacterium]|nr:hypothetical protein [Bacteroidales bacterium]
MKINELNSEDKLNATTLDEIKGNGSGLPGGCCMVNFSTNSSSGSPSTPTDSTSVAPAGGTSQSDGCFMNFGPNSRFTRRWRRRGAKKRGTAT